MLRFFQRRYPSANVALLTGPSPILVDTGFGSDAAELLDWLGPDVPALIVNTHFHSDHVGGNHAVQRRFGIPVAASAPEAAAVNRRDPDACEASWLDQPIEAYTVDRVLAAGDTLSTGSHDWTVLATPGHTQGHLSLFCRAGRTLVLGDALHEADLGWLCPFRVPGALDAAEATVDRLAALDATAGFSGHGRAVTDVAAAIDRARRRLRSWRARPEQLALHACKRIFAHALMLHDGIEEAALAPSLTAWPWFCDHAAHAFGLPPPDFVPVLLAEMLRADAAYWDGGVLRPRAEYRPPQAGWQTSPGQPARWNRG